MFVVTHVDSPTSSMIYGKHTGQQRDVVNNLIDNEKHIERRLALWILHLEKRLPVQLEF